MSQGFLIFAFNNKTLDYLSQAVWVADRISRFLDKPTTIVTDTNSLADKNIKHNIVIAEAETKSKRNFDIHTKDKIDHWYNVNRYQAYDISPYDETVVIDSDYIVNSDQLNKLFNNPHDFLCHRNVYDVASKNSLSAYQTFGQTKMPHYWATILYFRKSDFAKEMFDTITMIKDNYKFYSNIYKFNSLPYRNDYAVSIAQSIMHGHRLDAIPTIPWHLPTALNDIYATQLSDTEFEITYEKWSRNKMRLMRSIVTTDFHCLNKFAMEDMINADIS